MLSYQSGIVRCRQSWRLSVSGSSPESASSAYCRSPLMEYGWDLHDWGYRYFSYHYAAIILSKSVNTNISHISV